VSECVGRSSGLAVCAPGLCAIWCAGTPTAPTAALCVTPIDIIIIILIVIQLFTSSDTGNKIYFVSAAVRQMLAADGRGQLHTVHAGVKVFEKNPTKNDAFDYRLRQV
jgi:hypothetical protein